MSEKDILKSDETVLCELYTEIIEISKQSYIQEEERNKKLITKGDNIVKYVSFIFVFMNSFITLLYKYNSNIENPNLLILTYLLSNIFLIASFILAVKSQQLQKTYYFPTGTTVIKVVQEENINSAQQLKLKRILYYDSCTNSLSEVNSKISKSTNLAFWLYIVALGTLVYNMAIWSLIFI